MAREEALLYEDFDFIEEEILRELYGDDYLKVKDGEIVPQEDNCDA